MTQEILSVLVNISCVPQKKYFLFFVVCFFEKNYATLLGAENTRINKIVMVPGLMEFYQVARGLNLNEILLHV